MKGWEKYKSEYGYDGLPIIEIWNVAASSSLDDAVYMVSNGSEDTSVKKRDKNCNDSSPNKKQKTDEV